MGVLDFLFEGKPPPSVTTYGSSTESIPKWLSDYTQGVISRANSIAGEGYQTYGGPRIAGFTDDQQDSFDLTRQNIGSYKPGMDLAKSFEEQAAGSSSMDAANPYLSAATRTFTGSNVNDYMNPYTDSVIDKAKMDATRFYDETLAPRLSKQFTAAGQYGSSQHEREALKGARDITEGLQTNANAARADAYTTAGDLFGADAGRAGQAAGIAGNLTGSDAALKLRAGESLGMLEQARYGLGASDSAALNAVGSQQQGLNQQNLNLAYQDFNDQKNYDREQVDWLNSLIHGMPYDRTGTTTTKGPMGNQYAPSNASSILSLISAVKGMGTGENGDFAWGNIFGNGGGGSGDGGGSFDWGNDGGSTDWGGGFGWKDGGRVDTSSLDEQIARLIAKQGGSRRGYETLEYEGE